MKNFAAFFAVLALLLLNFASVTAQNSDKIRETGLKLGLNWNDPVFSDSKFSSSSKLGYEIGAYYRRGAFVWFESGLYYFHFKSSESISDSAQNGDLIYSNITLPLLVGLRLLGAQKALNLQLFGGANVGYLVDGKFDLLNLTTSNFEHWQFDPTIGAGVDVLIISVRLTYSYGVTNVLKDYGSHSSYIGLYIGFHL